MTRLPLLCLLLATACSADDDSDKAAGAGGDGGASDSGGADGGDGGTIEPVYPTGTRVLLYYGHGGYSQVGDAGGFTDFDDHKGWSEQGDGNWFYGLNVENGRIADNETHSLKTAIREICTTLDPGIHFTGHQDIIFSGIAEADKGKLEDILRKHKVVLTEEISNTLRWSMACVAWPTCGLSITESERALPGMVDDLEKEVEKLGLSGEKFTMRMTGCPNGCARPYNSDIGLVGRAKEKYTMFLGGRLLGNRLSYIYKDMVPADEVVPELVKVLTVFKEQRIEGESLGDFCDRLGQEKLLEAAGG